MMGKGNMNSSMVGKGHHHSTGHTVRRQRISTNENLNLPGSLSMNMSGVNPASMGGGGPGGILNE
jgi:hypothetical protein